MRPSRTSLFDAGDAACRGAGSASSSRPKKAGGDDGRSGRRSRVEPTAPQRYRVGMTIGEVTHVKLGEATALLSHRVPSGDVAVVFDLALDALLTKLRKERSAATDRPRRSDGARPRVGGAPVTFRRT